MEEEQRRGITMRASAIGLRHQYTPPTQKQQSAASPIIVHLLDSPGHTDFSPEVSSSLQCCDGCLLVVDAVEGMCARTHQVVREAHSHQLVPVLVINKVDVLTEGQVQRVTNLYPDAVLVSALKSTRYGAAQAASAWVRPPRTSGPRSEREHGSAELVKATGAGST